MVIVVGVRLIGFLLILRQMLKGMGETGREFFLERHLASLEKLLISLKNFIMSGFRVLYSKREH